MNLQPPFSSVTWRGTQLFWTFFIFGQFISGRDIAVGSLYANWDCCLSASASLYNVDFVIFKTQEASFWSTVNIHLASHLVLLSLSCNLNSLLYLLLHLLLVVFSQKESRLHVEVHQKVVGRYCLGCDISKVTSQHLISRRIFLGKSRQDASQEYMYRSQVQGVEKTGRASCFRSLFSSTQSWHFCWLLV